MKNSDNISDSEINCLPAIIIIYDNLFIFLSDDMNNKLQCESPSARASYGGDPYNLLKIHSILRYPVCGTGINVGESTLSWIP